MFRQYDSSILNDFLIIRSCSNILYAYFFSFHLHFFLLYGWNVLFLFWKELSDDESSVGSSVGAGDSEPCQPKSTTSRDEINALERRVMAFKNVDHNFTNTWKQYSTTIKTCSIVSLALCKLTGDLLLSSGEVFQICHLDQLLIALEVQYWHALLLHSNSNILSFLSLKEYSIISPGPYLIEQEVIAARIILRTIIDIYISSESCQELGLFIAPWISRYINKLQRYYLFDFFCADSNFTLFLT